MGADSGCPPDQYYYKAESPSKPHRLIRQDVFFCLSYSSTSTSRPASHFCFAALTSAS